MLVEEFYDGALRQGLMYSEIVHSPTHIDPMILHPAIEVWTTGIVSESSPSNILQIMRYSIRSSNKQFHMQVASLAKA